MRRLNLDSRMRLEHLLALPFAGLLEPLSMSKKLPKIAFMLGISVSTIYREVYGRGFTFNNYSAVKAHSDSLSKVSNGNTHYKYSFEQQQLIFDVIKRYKDNKSWSLNGLLLRLKLELPNNIKLPCLETLYQWIYEDSKLGGKMYLCLLRVRKKRKIQSKTRLIKVTNKVSIHQRDEVINTRERIGDAEIDSILSAEHKAGLLTGIDRKSRLIAASLVLSKSNEHTYNNLLVMFKKFKLKSITSDNGTEFACHERLSQTLQVPYYFADPYASYQRGSNEHANGMIRRYYPKGTDFKDVTDDALQDVVYKINHLPRKIHKGRTAFEVHYSIKKSLINKKLRNTLAFAFRT